jgi:hypothetical protein
MATKKRPTTRKTGTKPPHKGGGKKGGGKKGGGKKR